MKRAAFSTDATETVFSSPRLATDGPLLGQPISPITIFLFGKVFANSS